MKVCFRCKGDKPPSEFYKRAASKDGLQDECKECARGRNRHGEAGVGRKPRYWPTEEEKRAKAAAWRASNRDRIRAKQTQYFAENKALFQHHRLQRKARKLQASPKWADKRAIAQIYKTAYKASAALRMEFHVDHIVPLKARTACGLHVEHNLQIVFADYNREKHNRLDFPMPAALITPILISAAIGAVTAAVTGGNILKGALFGAVGGAIGGAFLGAGASGATGAAAEGAALGGTSASAGIGAPAFNAGMDAALIDTAAGATGVGAPSAMSGMASIPFESSFTQSAGASSAGNVQAPSASTAISEGASNTGQLSAPVQAEIGVKAPQTTLGQGGSNTGFYDGGSMEPVSSAAGNVRVPTRLESMAEFVFGKDGMFSKDGIMNQQWSNGLAGNAFKGLAGGLAEQKKIDFLREQEERKRQNARFGTQTSRFTPVGLVATANKNTFKA
jgi:energy-converting hydrogenase Eha subunit A